MIFFNFLHIKFVLQTNQNCKSIAFYGLSIKSKATVQSIHAGIELKCPTPNVLGTTYF